MIQVVIYLGSAPLTMLPHIDRRRCKFSYDIVNMQEVPARVFLKSPRSAERALAVVSRSKDPRATIRKILASWKGLPGNELYDNLERLTTLSQLRKSEIMAEEEVERMPFDLDITENEIYKLGARQGQAKGRLEAARQMFAKLVENRFGPLSPTVRTKLGRATQEQVDGWVGKFHTIQKVSDLFGSPQ